MSEIPRRCLIVPFGFDASIVLRGCSRFSLGDGDRIVLLVPTGGNPRRDAAIEDVKGFLKSLNSRGITIGYEVLEVDCTDIGGVVMKVAEIMSSGDKGLRYYIDASAGVRSLCVALTIAAILLKPKISGFYTIDESTGRTFEVKLPACTLRLTNTKREILELVYRNRVMKARSIARTLGRDSSTIHRHLVELAEANLLESDASYDASYRLTYTGRLALKNMEGCGGKRC